MARHSTKTEQPNKKAERKPEPARRIVLLAGTGSTGTLAVSIARSMAPSLRGFAFAVGGEFSREEEFQNEDVISVPDAPIDHFRATGAGRRIIEEDPVLPYLVYPHDTEGGAGTCRPIGKQKFSCVFPEIRKKAGRALRRRLMKLGEHQDQRLIIDFHLATAAGGGLGSSSIVETVLIIRDLVRQMSPSARCLVTVHLFMAGHFDERIADDVIRTKVYANDLATLLELNWAQNPAHVATLYEHLGCHPQPVPTLDRLVPYGIADERGATLTLEGVIKERLVPNILAGECAALANRQRELASNTAARDGARRVTVYPMVSMVQAAHAMVPQQFGTCWAQREALRAIAATLSKPSTERLKAFEGPAKTVLGIEGIKTEIARVCGETLPDVLTVAKTTRNQSSAQAHASLTEINSRYLSAVRPGIEAKLETLSRHFDEVAIPETVTRLHESLVDRGATLSELVSTFRSLERALVDLLNRTEEQAEKVATEVKKKRDALNGFLQQLAAKPILAGSLKEKAATVLNDTINADNVFLRHRGFRAVLRAVSRQISDAAHEHAAVHREVAKVGAGIKRSYYELRDLSTVQTTTYRSVILPEELEAAMQRLDSAVRASNEALPALDVKGLVAGGHPGVAQHLDTLVQDLVTAFEEFSEMNLPDVASTVRALRLGFSLRSWIEDTVRNLACCSPAGMSAALSGVEPQTTVIAAGDDLYAVKQSLARRPNLAHLDVIQGSDPRSVLIYRRNDGHTIQSIPSWVDSLRAAEQYPKPAPGLTAFECLIGSGFFLGAYEQVGLVPEKWLTPAPQPANQRRTSKPVGVNGSQL